MKEAMLNCVTALKHHGMRARLVCQLHDEVLFECKDEDAQASARIVREQMENMAQLNGHTLPRLPVSNEIGQSWGDMRKL